MIYIYIYIFQAHKYSEGPHSTLRNYTLLGSKIPKSPQKQKMRKAKKEEARNNPQSLLTLLGPHSRFGDKTLGIRVVSPQNRTAVGHE